MANADSAEMITDTSTAVIVLMPKISKTHVGGTMRLGLRATVFQINVIVMRSIVHVEKFEKMGITFIGRDKSGEYIEIVKLDDHSRPLHPCLFYKGSILAAFNKINTL